MLISFSLQILLQCIFEHILHPPLLSTLKAVQEEGPGSFFLTPRRSPAFIGWIRGGWHNFAPMLWPSVALDRSKWEWVAAILLRGHNGMLLGTIRAWAIPVSDDSCQNKLANLVLSPVLSAILSQFCRSQRHKPDKLWVAWHSACWFARVVGTSPYECVQACQQWF